MNHQLLLIVLRWILWWIILLWCKVLRYQFEKKETIAAYSSEHKKYIVVFWHGSMFIGWFLHRPKKKQNVSALVSQSNDGEYLSTLLERWHYSLIRGSSHIGGKEAMQLMQHSIETGNSVVITPDGPTGPRHSMKIGAVRLAQKTGVPLLLCGIAMKNKKQLKSWDRFEIPRPFSKIAVVYSEAITVPPDLSGEPLNLFLRSVEAKLMEINVIAEKKL